MTASALSNNLPVLPSIWDTAGSNLVEPTIPQFTNGFADNVDSITAEAYNYLHNASSGLVWLGQLLGLAQPFNPVAGASIVAVPAGGIVTLQDSVSGATQWYVALANMAIGFTDPSLDPTHWALINFTNLATHIGMYADAGGTSDAITANYPSVIYPVLGDGFTVTVDIATPNTTTTPTLQVTLNGSVKTAYQIVKKINNIEYPLAPGDLQGDVDFIFDLPNTKWIAKLPSSGLWQPGDFKIVAGTSAPIGFLACPTSPTNISRTAYAALFAAIGTTWGAGDGSTTFGMPYVPTGYTLVQGSSASLTHGALLAHTHQWGVNGQSGVTSGAGNLGAPGTGSWSPTSSTGGADNLAAGMGGLVCVKY